MDIPGTGTNQPIFLTDLAANRSENVTLADLRLDKAFAADPLIIRSHVYLDASPRKRPFSTVRTTDNSACQRRRSSRPHRATQRASPTT